MRYVVRGKRTQRALALSEDYRRLFNQGQQSRGSLGSFCHW